VVKVKLFDARDPKQRLDGYDLIGELAHGGRATTLLGRAVGVDSSASLVAIKQLHPHVADDDAELPEAFVHAARVSAGIQRPHVVPILAVGDRLDGPYLTMRFIEGDTLARLHARSLAKADPIPRPVLFRVFLDALAGLDAIHESRDAQGHPLNLVHGDIWPQNILVGQDGRSWISDFALAHAAARLPSLGADRLKGKTSYVAPERARGRAVDRRADVFSMGVILWEMLTGRRLFKAENEARMLFNVTAGPIPSLSTTAIGVGAAIDKVCDKALARDVEPRFQTAAEMAAALEHALRSLPSVRQPSIGSADDVSTYIHSHYGAELAAQRESIRRWSEQRAAARTRKRFSSCHDASPELTDRILCEKFGGIGLVGAKCVSSEGRDLSGWDLRGANLRRALLRGAKLVGTKLAGANLSTADLSETDLEGADLTGADLSQTILMGAHAPGVTFDKATLARTVFSKADLTGASLTGVKGTMCVFQETTLTSARLSGAHFFKALFSQAKLDGAYFTGVELDRCVFVDSSALGTRFDRVRMSTTSFIGCTMTGASFYAVSGERCGWLKTGVDKADFRFARLRRAQFNKASLNGAQLYAADFRGGRFDRSSLAEADFSNADLMSVSFCKAKLSATSFSRASLYDAKFLGAVASVKCDFSGANLKRAMWEES
jgi:uncharacterized protein YjbI with pentapeptide repeats